jgi:hypothetical protein
MSADDNKAVLLHLAKAFNKRSLAIIDDVFSPPLPARCQSSALAARTRRRTENVHGDADRLPGALTHPLGHELLDHIFVCFLRRYRSEDLSQV